MTGSPSQDPSTPSGKVIFSAVHTIRENTNSGAVPNEVLVRLYSFLHCVCEFLLNACPSSPAFRLVHRCFNRDV